MAVSVTKIGSGRKRESAVWHYFEYIPETNKTRCLVAECGAELAGKNPTNLKVHLSTHADFYALFISEDKQTKELNAASKLHSGSVRKMTRNNNTRYNKLKRIAQNDVESDAYSFINEAYVSDSPLPDQPDENFNDECDELLSNKKLDESNAASEQDIDIKPLPSELQQLFVISPASQSVSEVSESEQNEDLQHSKKKLKIVPPNSNGRKRKYTSKSHRKIGDCRPVAKYMPTSADDAFVEYIRAQLLFITDVSLREKTKLKIEEILSNARVAMNCPAAEQSSSALLADEKQTL